MKLHSPNRFRPVLYFRDGSSRTPVQAKQHAYATVAAAASVLRRALREAQVGYVTGGKVIDCQARGAGEGIVLDVRI